MEIKEGQKRRRKQKQRRNSVPFSCSFSLCLRVGVRFEVSHKHEHSEGNELLPFKFSGITGNAIRKSGVHSGVRESMPFLGRRRKCVCVQRIDRVGSFFVLLFDDLNLIKKETEIKSNECLQNKYRF